MNIYLFDMDGVLLRPLGYHRALKETVRLAGISIGLGEMLLTDEQIAVFESLGISSEWHSSALCMAMMVLQKTRGILGEATSSQPNQLNLQGLFDELAVQSIKTPALDRGIGAIEKLTRDCGTSREYLIKLVEIIDSICYNQKRVPKNPYLIHKKSKR